MKEALLFCERDDGYFPKGPGKYWRVAIETGWNHLYEIWMGQDDASSADLFLVNRARAVLPLKLSLIQAIYFNFQRYRQMPCISAKRQIRHPRVHFL